jgi:tetratricopeptide (TPR) repeat protein
MIRRFAAILLALAGLALACRRQPAAPASADKAPPVPLAPTPAGLVRVVAPQVEAADLQRLPLPEARQRLDDLYRLPPDRRFIAGVAAAKRILRGGGPSTVQLTFVDGRWKIACDGQSVGTLPEYPTYADARELLKSWTAQLGAVPKAGGTASSAAYQAAQSISQSDLVSTLSSIDRKWNPSVPDAGLARSAGRALTLMCLQRLDWPEQTNDISGQALAAVAIAENLGEPMTSEQALLGRVLGYGPEAREIAKGLQPGDPVRLYVEGNGAALKSFAEAHPSDALSGYLALLSLPAKDGSEAWERWSKAHYFQPDRILETLHAELAYGFFEATTRCAEGVLGTWMRRLDPEWSGGEPEPSDSSGKQGSIQQFFAEYIESIQQKLRGKPAGLLRRFEAALAKKPSPGPGPFWSAESDRTWARASFYSAIDALGRFYLDQLSSEQGAASFALFLQDAPDGIGSQYAAWYQHLAASKRGENVVDALAADAGRAGIGYGSASRSMVECQVAIIEQGRPVAEILSAYSRVLDTRPDARYRLLERLEKARFTIPFARLCVHCRGDEFSDWTSAWCASVLGDSRFLQRIAADPKQSIERRVQAVETLGSRGDIPVDSLRAQYRRLVEEDSYSRATVRPYVLYMDWAGGDFHEQLRVVDGFLAHYKTQDLLRDMYVGRRAHCLSGLGQHAEAWKTIEPTLESGQGAVMNWASEILWELGRKDESLALARKGVERYPDSTAMRADLARLLWRAQRDSEAALVLGDPRRPAQVYTWQNEYSTAFFDAFGKAPPDRAVGAFRALQDQRIGFWSLETVPYKLGDKGRAEHAFRLYEQLSGKGSFEYPWPKARAYQYLGKWKGEADAQNWIVENFDARMIPVTGPAFFATENYELLWLLKTPGAEPTSETWLLRAGGAALQGLDHAPHREELLAHFRDAETSTDLRAHLGRHVLGIETAEDLLRRPRKPEEDADAAYFLGLRAYVEGRLLDAGDWLQLVPLRGKAHNYDAAALRTRIEQQIAMKGLSPRERGFEAGR